MLLRWADLGSNSDQPTYSQCGQPPRKASATSPGKWDGSPHLIAPPMREAPPPPFALGSLLGPVGWGCPSPPPSHSPLLTGPL